MDNCNETVTISVSRYEQMKAEINRLRQENKEKTIIQIREPKWYDYAVLVLMIAGVSFAWLTMSTCK